MGDPWELTHGQWVLALVRIEWELMRENPPSDTQAALTQDLDLTVRVQRRQEMVQKARSEHNGRR